MDLVLRELEKIKATIRLFAPENTAQEVIDDKAEELLVKAFEGVPLSIKDYALTPLFNPDAPIVSKPILVHPLLFQDMKDCVRTHTVGYASCENGQPIQINKWHRDW